MAYLGNKPVNNFVSFAKQDITGNGGTSYSLDYPVTGANDIELFINNVRQEPTEAYSCAGSTLTLTGAVSSTDDVYVIFRGRALQTAQHPSDSALEASQATISGEATITGNAFIGANGTAIPNSNLASNLDFLQVGTGALIQAGTDSQSFIKSNHYWNGSSTSFQDTSRGSTTIRLNENNAGMLQFETATSGGVGTTSRLTIDAAGRVTMPYQPAFHARAEGIYTVSGNTNNLTFDGTFLNRGSMYSTSTNRMTAPIAGTYWIHFEGLIHSNERDTVDIRFYKNGGQTQTATIYQVDYGSSYRKVTMTSIIDLSANDYIDIRPQSSSGVYTFYGDSGAFISTTGGGHTAFKGYLIG